MRTLPLTREKLCQKRISANQICNGKIIQLIEDNKDFPEILKIKGPGAWITGQIIVKTYCPKCGQTYPELNHSPL